jgi:hypothetical protein
MTLRTLRSTELCVTLRLLPYRGTFDHACWIQLIQKDTALAAIVKYRTHGQKMPARDANEVKSRLALVVVATTFGSGQTFGTLY